MTINTAIAIELPIARANWIMHHSRKEKTAANVGVQQEEDTRGRMRSFLFQLDQQFFFLDVHRNTDSVGSFCGQ